MAMRAMAEPVQASSTLDEVRRLAADLPVGGRSIHLTCPQCGGGHSKEKSFVVVRKGGALFYQCYRNKCNFSGKIASKAGDILPATAKKPDEYTWETQKLTEAQELFLENKYELYPETIVLNRVKYAPGIAKYVFPIFNVDGREVGVMDRRFNVTDKASRSYWFDKDLPRVDFPREVHPKIGRRLVVVEDKISAMKINQLGKVAVCALLGTGVSDRLMQYLATLTDGVTFMLDPDAIQTALRYRQRYNLLFKHPIAVVQLRADPKDTPLKHLEELIY